MLAHERSTPLISTLSSLSSTSTSSTPQVTLPVNKHCADPRNEVCGSVAKTTPLTEAEEDVKETTGSTGGQIARHRKHSVLGTGSYGVRHRSGSTGTNGTQPSWLQGDVEVPRYRLHKDVEPIFSATLPLEVPRLLLWSACQERFFLGDECAFLISIADVSRLHFFAYAVRGVHVRLLTEDPKPKDPARCMWNTKDDARLWMLLSGGETIAPRSWRWMIFPRRGFSTPFLPWKFADLHLGAW